MKMRENLLTDRQTVSIIVAIYNLEGVLQRCLDSLIQVDERVLEILCVNDGSTDSSEQIIQSFEQKDARVILFNKPNGGLSSARNFGIRQAKGDYILFVDGDDYIFWDKLNYLLDELEREDKPLDAVWTGYVREDWNGIHEEHTKLNKGYLQGVKVQDTLIPALLGISLHKLQDWLQGKRLLNRENEFPSVWRGIYARRVIEKNQILFSEAVCTGEDILFNFEFFAMAENVLISDTCYYCYVWRKGSLTQDGQQNFLFAKTLQIKERELAAKEVLQKTGQDYRGEYQGSLILTKIQMAVALSNCNLKDVVEEYRKFSAYVSLKPIRNAYKKLNLKHTIIKYRIPLYLAKANFDRILFGGCFMLNKLKIHIYPDE